MDDSDDSSSSSDSEIEQLASKACSTISAKLERQNKAIESHRETRSRTKKQTVVKNEEIGFVIDKKRGPDTVLTIGDDIPSFMGNENENEVITDIKETPHKTGGSKKGNEKETSSKEKRKRTKNFQLSTSIQSGLSLNDTYLTTALNVGVKPPKQSRLEAIISGSKSDNTILKKSILTPDLERKDCVPAYEETLKQKKLQKKKDRTMTKGKNWFNMKAPEMTEEKRNDLMVLKMRKALDPKRFYKSNDIKALPKFFQFGRVIESPADFYHSRIPKKQRKATMVEELLADAEFRKYNKRKYEEIQEARMKRKGPYQHTVMLGKKKRKPTKDKGMARGSKKKK